MKKVNIDPLIDYWGKAEVAKFQTSIPQVFER